MPTNTVPHTIHRESLTRAHPHSPSYNTLGVNSYPHTHSSSYNTEAVNSYPHRMSLIQYRRIGFDASQNNLSPFHSASLKLMRVKSNFSWRQCSHVKLLSCLRQLPPSLYKLSCTSTHNSTLTMLTHSAPCHSLPVIQSISHNHSNKHGLQCSYHRVHMTKPARTHRAKESLQTLSLLQARTKPSTVRHVLQTTLAGAWSHYPLTSVQQQIWKL